MAIGISHFYWRSNLIAIAAASFAVCVAIDLFYFGNSTMSADEDRFLRSASQLLAQGQFRVGNDVAWEMPGTAIFFAAVTSLLPMSALTAIRIANAALVSLQSILLGLLAARVFQDRLAGLFAAAIGGFYPYILFTQGMALSETPFIFLLIASFLALYVWRDRGAFVDWTMALAVAVLTAATFTKATLTILPPILVAAAAIGKRRWSDGLRVFIAAAALYTVLMSPWWVRNYSLLGEFVPFTTSASQNLYIGNSPNNPQVGTYFPYLPQNWAVDQGVSLDTIPGELDRSKALRDRALAYIERDPADFFRRAIIKLRVFWNIMPNAPGFQKPLYKVMGAASFGPVLALAIICLIQRRRQFFDLLPFYITIGYFTVLYTVTIPSIRYRLPIEPLLIVLSAGPLALFVRRGAIVEISRWQNGPPSVGGGQRGDRQT